MDTVRHVSDEEDIFHSHLKNSFCCFVLRFLRLSITSWKAVSWMEAFQNPNDLPTSERPRFLNFRAATLAVICKCVQLLMKVSYTISLNRRRRVRACWGTRTSRKPGGAQVSVISQMGSRAHRQKSPEQLQSTRACFVKTPVQDLAWVSK